MKNRLKPGDSVAPLLFFRMDRDGWINDHQMVQDDSIPNKFGMHRFVDSIYYNILYSWEDSCKVHHCPLLLDTVDVPTGLPDMVGGEFETKKGQIEARHNIYPNANLYASSLIFHNYEHPLFAEVEFCPICRLYAIEWEDWYAD